MEIIPPTDADIEAVRDEALGHAEDCKFPHMTYTEGVLCSLDWVLGINPDRPMSED